MSVLKKVMYFAYLVYAKSSEVNGDIMPVLKPVGGERDDNNCLTGAGFSWCETSQSCIRIWETPCEDNYSDCCNFIYHRWSFNLRFRIIKFN